jgi:hypothetical protein
LKCAYCFADGGAAEAKDPDLDTVQGYFERLLAAGGPYNIQLSGGEPTLREDLPDIVVLGRSLGFQFIQVNTNGLRLAAHKAYATELKDAGAASIFLQFDGVTEATYETLRGRALLPEKRLAVEHCAAGGLGVILVPTLVPGINIHEIGAIIRFAVQYMPTVRGVHFQPVSYFGRYPTAPGNEARITIPEVIREIEMQTGGELKAEHFRPPGCENALCSFTGNFVLLADGELRPRTRRDAQQCCSSPESAAAGAARTRQFVSRFWSAAEAVAGKASGPSLGGWDDFLERVRSHSLCISGMAFQDAWNLDLDRLRDCCIHVVDADGGLIPFCAYNLTDSQKRSFYRKRAVNGER